MIGIYKITNLINEHCYIGQSRQIERRWKHHIMAAYNSNDKGYHYPLQRAIRKYGESNFSFIILEKCEIEQLNEKEIYWINYYNPIYNQTIGDKYNIVFQKLSVEKVQQIQQILLNDINGLVNHKELADQFNVHPDTIRDINVGRTWFDQTLTYPLHYSRFDHRKPKTLTENHCIDCGACISYYAIRCTKCNGLYSRTDKPVTRNELKQLIKDLPFTKIGEKFKVSDNAIRKWCKFYNLPSKKSEIKKYSEEEWEQL